jgi:hypothetical protein
MQMVDYSMAMGELAYNYLAHEANGTTDQRFSDWPGYSPVFAETYDSMGYLSPLSPPNSYAASPNSMYVLASTRSQNPLTSHLRTASSPYSPSPSPSLSQTSSTPEHYPVSPQPSPAPESPCRQATPVFNPIRMKYCCSVCDKGFRGEWECERHIEFAGKRVDCLACGKNIALRPDSRRRHFTKYCKGNTGNLRFEDAFIAL